MSAATALCGREAGYQTLALQPSFSLTSLPNFRYPSFMDAIVLPSDGLQEVKVEEGKGGDDAWDSSGGYPMVIGEEEDGGGERVAADSGTVCRVCGDQATGMYFGALVCVPCKTFFLRYAGDGFSFACKHNKQCEISIANRTQCKYCRYQKCVSAGMKRRVRPAHVQHSEGQQICCICQDVANGIHFGVITCEGCKKFFRRGLKEHATYVCKSTETCIINPRTRNTCRYCRYNKCLAAGMSREAIQMGRPSKLKYDRDPCGVMIAKLEPHHVEFNGRHLDPSYAESTEHSIQSKLPYRTRELDSFQRGGERSSDGFWSELPQIRRDSPGSGRVSLESLLSGGSNLQAAVREGVNKLSPDRRNRERGVEEAELQRDGYAATSIGVADTPDVQRDDLESREIQPVGQDGRVPGSTMRRRIGHVSLGSYCPPAVAELNNLAAANIPTSNSFSANGPPQYSFHNSTLIEPPSYPIPNFSQNWSEKMQLLSLLDFKQTRVAEGDAVSMETSGTPDSLMSAGGAGGAFGERNNTPDSCAPFSTPPPSARSMGQGGPFLPSGRGNRDEIIKSECMSVKDEEEDRYTTGERCSEALWCQSNQQQRDWDDTSPPIHPVVRKLSVGDCSGVRRLYSDIGAMRPRRQTMPSGYASTGGKAPAGYWKRRNNMPGGRAFSPGSPGSQSSGGSGGGGIDRRWETSSPYESLMELTCKWRLVHEASATQLEWHSSPRGGQAEGGAAGEATPPIGVLSDEDLERQARLSERYWRCRAASPPAGGLGEEGWPGEEDGVFEEKHREFIAQTLNCYDRFVQTSTKINRSLTGELKNWAAENGGGGEECGGGGRSSLPEWIQQQVVPVYTLTSITYCRNLVGFKTFHTDDQQTLIRLGQSPSRILVAAVHWYNPAKHDFDDFLSWRTDLFKTMLIECAANIYRLELDRVEAAMLNALIVIASDYPGLINPDRIEAARKDIISSFKAYITAKLGSQNDRLEKLFHEMLQVRKLGFLHYRMTKTHNLRAEDCTSKG